MARTTFFSPTLFRLYLSLEPETAGFLLEHHLPPARDTAARIPNQVRCLTSCRTLSPISATSHLMGHTRFSLTLWNNAIKSYWSLVKKVVTQVSIFPPPPLIQVRFSKNVLEAEVYFTPLLYWNLLLSSLLSFPLHDGSLTLTLGHQWGLPDNPFQWVLVHSCGSDKRLMYGWLYTL